MQRVKTALAWFAGLILATLLGSIIQTQFNLAMIQALGAPMNGSLRLQSTAHDLLNFAPTYGVLVVAAFLIALPVSGLLARLWPEARTLLHTLAGAIGIAVALVIMNHLLPVTMIGASRFHTGILALSLAGALGGLLFAWTSRSSAQAA
ncbi:hypothetical protein [Ectothiorhodospira marina]|jgi:hypothetical protein|uniref:Uncharacterized protein n=1 Tax=Ectothiorhodospira marina TaxID=1396821 RepID=A0A1H7PSC4_9GAMM|nr:hypothetical protein [Ectothiorhodospira marina]SEL38663.1 hypothetical protein SAMN05444515_1156 [Ectothiorhodospira marina]